MTDQISQSGALRQEILLQVNERLYTQEEIPKSIYEQAKRKIIELT